MSLLASFMSGITILGNPAESYNYGTMFVWAGLAHIMVAITVANVFIPVCLVKYFSTELIILKNNLNSFTID